jgi:CheY-like chemotaxis protein
MKQIHLLHSITSVNKGLDFRFYIDTELPRFIVSDETKLQHVINRLLSNAVRYTRKGGVQLSAELLSSEDDRFFIKITISDTGLGIPPELHEYVFKKQEDSQDLAVRSFNGSELGASVLRTFVEMIGGRISMDSSSETGTTFSFFFMALASSGEASLLSGSLSDVQAGYPRVLIAEGDDYNRLVMEHLLRRRAREIESVKNIQEAMDCLSRGEFDLAFIDASLKSSSGRGLEEIMRAGTGGDYIRIIGLTGSAFRKPKGKYLRPVLTDFWKGPYQRPGLSRS